MSAVYAFLVVCGVTVTVVGVWIGLRSLAAYNTTRAALSGTKGH